MRISPMEKMLANMAGMAGDGTAMLVNWREHAWNSMTFKGSRAEADLLFTGAAVAYGEAMLECIGEGEFAVPGLNVVDARVLFCEASTTLCPPDNHLRAAIALTMLEPDHG